MMELIHMTVAYSNAMLVAILPQVSDFANKLDLPVSQPITTNQVVWFNPSRYKGFIGGGLVVSNSSGRYLFGYAYGTVDGFRSLNDNPFYDQDPAKNLASYAFGKDNMTTNEAIELARETLRKLGYEPKLLHADIPPSSLQGPADLKDGHHVPYCNIRWDGSEPKTLEEQKDSDRLEFQINMEKKTVVGMEIASRKIRRTPPEIDVEPELESEYRQHVQKPMFIRTNAPAHRLPHNFTNAPVATPVEKPPQETPSQ